MESLSYNYVSGNVAATCAGLNRIAQCDVSVMQPNIYHLRIFPKESGPHVLQIQYDEEDVPGNMYYQIS